MSALQINGVGKQYPGGTQALKEVSLEVAKGSFVVILGPSGAGKSTLLRMMNGLDWPTVGQVRVAGELLTKRSVRRIRSRVGMVFQQFNLVGRLNVLTNVLMGRLAQHGLFEQTLNALYLFRREDRDIAVNALARVGLIEKAWQRADQLSGGQQQRVGIARALAQRPQVILADEPVASLDPANSEEILKLLRDICCRDGITVVVNLHQVDLAVRYADRILGLRAGLLVFDGPPAALTETELDRLYEGAVVKTTLEPAYLPASPASLATGQPLTGIGDA